MKSRSFTLIFTLIPLICCQKFDPRCVIPHTRPSQNLPHETSCDVFYKCFHGYALLLPCPRGTIFHTFSLTCVSKESANCVIVNPTPPTIQPTTTTQFIPTTSTLASITSSFTTPTAPILTTSSSSTLPPDEIPMPSNIFTIPTAPTITATKFFRPTPPNINAKRSSKL